jgi:hypothetical protein
MNQQFVNFPNNNNIYIYSLHNFVEQILSVTYESHNQFLTRVYIHCVLKFISNAKTIAFFLTSPQNKH